MKIVDRKTFLAMPAGTLYSKCEAHGYGPLELKDDTFSHDFYTVSLADVASNAVEGYPLDLIPYRDGLREEEQLFAVWEKIDVATLIAALQAAYRD